MYNPMSMSGSGGDGGGVPTKGEMAGGPGPVSAAPRGAAVPDAFAGGNMYSGGAPTSTTAYSSGGQIKAASVDNSLLCSKDFMQLTVGAIGSTASTTSKTAMPFGMTCHPMAEPPGSEPLPVVNFGAAGVVRCKTCRAYINPFAEFIEGGRRWVCPLCARANDVPSAYFVPLDDKGKRKDFLERPELCTGSVEFVAPSEYMVRPPQAPVYMFVIDVSYNAVSSGMLKHAVQAIRACLDKLPGDSRTQVGFLTFDSTIHFYNLKASLSAPQMLVVSDITEPFLPVPDDLLVNLSDSKTVVEALLESLPDMFASSSTVEACLGPALQSAYTVMKHIGGKMLVFQASLPSLGVGKLRQRENPRLIGTDTEHTLLAAGESFYKDQAIEFSRVQISVDLFLGSPTYTDVATLSDLPKHTAGHLYHYPAFSSERDGSRFESDVRRDLLRTTGWEAVMRIRCSRGVRVRAFHGNFYLRGPDLLALPNVTSDTACSLDLEYVDALNPGTIIVMQSALLYTTSSGERRICVHTYAAPVTTVATDLFSNVDAEAITNLIAAHALETMKRTGLASARQLLHRKCVEIMRAFRAASSHGYGAVATSKAMPLPENLQLLPLYMMALQKSALFRGGTDVHTDERSFLAYQVCGMSVARSATFVYPRLYRIHDMPSTAGTPSSGDVPGEVGGEKHILMPPVAGLSAERLTADGVFLLNNGVQTAFWVGRAASPHLLESLFGASSLEGVDTSKIIPKPLANEFSGRVWAIIEALREPNPVQQQMYVVRQGNGDVNEVRFHWNMVEDRQDFAGAGVTYADYLQQVTRDSQASPAVSAAPARR